MSRLMAARSQSQIIFNDDAIGKEDEGLTEEPSPRLCWFGTGRIVPGTTTPSSIKGRGADDKRAPTAGRGAGSVVQGIRSW